MTFSSSLCLTAYTLAWLGLSQNINRCYNFRNIKFAVGAILNNEFSWFLLYCKPREEQRGLNNLQNQGIEAFYPTIKVEKLRKGIRSTTEEALFPNYLFVKLNPETANFNAIRSTRGIASFVRFGLQHAQVSPSVIEQLKATVVEHSAGCDEHHLPKIGEPVTINQGIYQGLDAIYQSSDGLERSILLIKMLEQQATLVLKNTEFGLKNN